MTTKLLHAEYHKPRYWLIRRDDEEKTWPSKHVLIIGTVIVDPIILCKFLVKYARSKCMGTKQSVVVQVINHICV
jgi:hypothetical protein